MNIVSTYTEGRQQVDGRYYVSELHTLDDGRTFPYEWLSDGNLDPQMVMEERALVIAATLAKRDAARIAVVGSAVALTRYEFLARFTPEERIYVRSRALTNPYVEDFMDLMRQSGDVSLVLARPGLAYIASLGGDLTPERAAVIGAD